MAYKALYRTYRPRTFKEVAGQRHIVRTLSNALSTGRIAHAYLFAGPRGTGKTTMAKLFAKALNCEKGIGCQCDACSNCQEINEGSHPDVIEIDAASNNGVEQVRDLIDKVGYLPIKGRYKVYIIDEVHMMTDNAFNALLKTLEEPPAHVVFILATTEPHAILPTIISRCQRYDFSKVDEEDIRNKLIEILLKENVTYEEDAVKAIVSLADGSVRDALSILDQILAYSGSSLKEKDVHALFGLASKEERIAFVQAIMTGDVAYCLKKIDHFSQGGIDLRRLTIDIITILKDVLIFKETLEDDELTTLTEDDAETLGALCDLDRLNAFIEIFLKGQVDFRSVSDLKMLFEILVLKMCTMSSPQARQNDDKTMPSEAPVPQKAVKEIETPEVSVSEKTAPVLIKEPPAAPEENAEPIRENPEDASKVKKTEEAPKEERQEQKTTAVPAWLFDDDPTDTKAEVRTAGQKNKLDDETIIKIMVLGDKKERRTLLGEWGKLDAQLNHPRYGDIIALIKDGKPFIVTKEAVVLEYDFEKLAGRVNIRSNQAVIGTVLKRMLGRDVFVYAISRSESVRLVTAYHNLRQISQLPRLASIKLDFSGMKQ